MSPIYISHELQGDNILVIIHWLFVAGDVVVVAGVGCIVGCIVYGGGSDGKSTKLLSKENCPPPLLDSRGGWEAKVGEQISSPSARVGE